MRSHGIAVIGAGRLIGREILAVLRERQFPIRQCRLFDTLEHLGGGDVEGEPRIELLDRAQFEGVDIAFLSATEVLSAEWAPRATAAGAVAIDLSQAFAEQKEIPLVVPETNPEAIADYAHRGMISCPVPGAVALAVAVGPINAAARVKRLLVATYEPVSTAGEAGVEELSNQTRDLMNGRSIEPDVFPHRIAFNLIPRVGELLEGGESRAERQIAAQTRRLLNRPDLPISVTSVWVPTFFGQGYTINVETEVPLGASEARALLREAPGVVLADDATCNDCPTAADAVGKQSTLVGRVREDPSVQNGLNLWVALDGMRKGSAVNAVQIAELLVRNHL